MKFILGSAVAGLLFSLPVQAVTLTYSFDNAQFIDSTSVSNLNNGAPIGGGFLNGTISIDTQTLASDFVVAYDLTTTQPGRFSDPLRSGQFSSSDPNSSVAISGNVVTFQQNLFSGHVPTTVLETTNVLTVAFDVLDFTSTLVATISEESFSCSSGQSSNGSCTELVATQGETSGVVATLDTSSSATATTAAVPVTPVPLPLSLGFLMAAFASFGLFKARSKNV